MLIAALVVLGVVVALGLFLASLYMLRETPPRFVPTVGWVHGSLGALGVVLLFLALRGAHRGATQGAGSFGVTAGVLLAITLAGGLTILVTHLRRRPVSVLLVAMHGTLGAAGYVILTAYFSSPASYRPPPPHSVTLR